MERRAFDLENTFHIMFETYKDKKNNESLGKNPQNYEGVCNETCIYEQKPMKIDDFKEADKKKVK